MPEIPDFFHALTGWRKFGVEHSGKVLKSAGQDVTWPVADLGEALCRMTHVSYDMQTDNTVSLEHDAPQLKCSCGFYCYKTREDAQQHAQGSVLARVEIWGRIAEHARGYRAQHMKILELFVAPGFNTIPSLEKRYHVPISVDTGAHTWISESPYASSSPNLSASPYGSPFVIPAWASLLTSPYLSPSQAAAQQQTAVQMAQYQQAQYQQALAQYASPTPKVITSVGAVIQIRFPRRYVRPGNVTPTADVRVETVPDTPVVTDPANLTDTPTKPKRFREWLSSLKGDA